MAAGAIAWYAVHRLIVAEPLQPLGPGMLVALVAAIVNGAAAVVLLRAGREHGSIVLEADGRHLLTDVWTGATVLAGLGLVWLTDKHVLDPLIALGVSANILWTGLDLIRRSFDGLMDHALPAEEQAMVRSAIERHLGPDMDYHALRTRRAGRRRFMDFHLLVPGRLTVQQAHTLTGEIEEAVRAVLPELEVSVHIEPIEDSSAWRDSALLPLERARRAGPHGDPTLTRTRRAIGCLSLRSAARQRRIAENRRRLALNILEFTTLIGLGALAAGFLGSLTGLGGGVIIVPLLVLMKVDLHYAIGASLVSVIATSSGSAASYVREGYSNIRIGMVLEIATTIGALTGAYLTTILDPRAISIVFGSVLLVSAYLSLRPPRERGRG